MGNMAIHKSIENGNLEIVKLLVDNQASVNAQNYFDRTPTHVAAKQNRIEILQLLLSLPDVVVTTVDKMSNNPWQTCLEKNNPFARLLLETHPDLRTDAQVIAFRDIQVNIIMYLA